MKFICPSCDSAIDANQYIVCSKYEYHAYDTNSLSREIINVRFSYILYKLFIDKLYSGSYFHELYSYERHDGKIENGNLMLNFVGNKTYLINYKMSPENIDKKIKMFQLFQ